MTDQQEEAGEQEPKKPGPDPERLKLEGDWEELVGKALKRKRPPDGWPEPEKKGRTEKSDP